MVVKRVADVRWAAINAVASGDTQVLAGEAGYKYRVISVTLVCSAAISVGWKSGTTVKVPGMAFAQNGGMDVNRPTPGTYFFETNEGEDITINLSGSATVTGSLNYVEIPVDE